MSKLIFNNYSRYIRTTQDHKIFALCVFLQGDETLMNSIRMVEYVLHPTFPNPVREITDREHCFVLQTEAWGIFNMQITVYFEDGRREDVDYRVKLEQDDWPKGSKMTSFESGNQRQIMRAYLIQNGSGERLRLLLSRQTRRPKTQRVSWKTCLRKDL
jgi:transcription initiation factor IIF auxiliary subunit